MKVPSIKQRDNLMTFMPTRTSLTYTSPALTCTSKDTPVPCGPSLRCKGMRASCQPDYAHARHGENNVDNKQDKRRNREPEKRRYHDQINKRQLEKKEEEKTTVADGT